MCVQTDYVQFKMQPFLNVVADGQRDLLLVQENFCFASITLSQQKIDNPRPSMCRCAEMQPFIYTNIAIGAVNHNL